MRQTRSYFISGGRKKKKIILDQFAKKKKILSKSQSFLFESVSVKLVPRAESKNGAKYYSFFSLFHIRKALRQFFLQ
jgi:hypothetical protein